MAIQFYYLFILLSFIFLLLSIRKRGDEGFDTGLGTYKIYPVDEQE